MRKTIRGKIELPPGQRAARLLMHVPVGLLTIAAFILGFILGLPPVAAAILGVGLGFACLIAFIIYEINEDRHIEDRAFHDILGFLAGLGTGIIILFCLGVTGIWKIQG